MHNDVSQVNGACLVLQLLKWAWAECLQNGYKLTNAGTEDLHAGLELRLLSLWEERRWCRLQN
jgi:hypothetical protein